MWTNRTARTAVSLASVTAAALLMSACSSSEDSETTSPEDQIKAVTSAYADAQGARDEAKLRQASCAAQVEREISEFDSESNPSKITVDAIDNVRVDGDKATASVSMTGTFASGQTEQQQGVPFTYVNESGWKVCLN
ncbi:Rv0361 family membrane protein [Tsukamurella pulmonis]